MGLLTDVSFTMHPVPGDGHYEAWKAKKDERLRGAEFVHKLVTDARKIYENQQFQFTGDYGDNGFLEEYTCKILGEPTSVVVTVKRNAAGKAQHLVVNHRPRSSVLLFAHLMGKTYAGTPLAKYFISSDP
jgi:hypothetical protein